MVGRLIEQQQLGRIASPEYAGQGRFQAFAAAERRQRQSDLIRAQLQLRQAGAPDPDEILKTVWGVGYRWKTDD